MEPNALEHLVGVVMTFNPDDPHEDQAGEKGWLATASRHWNIDRPDPR
jgi:hypothetical protein